MKKTHDGDVELDLVEHAFCFLPCYLESAIVMLFLINKQLYFLEAAEEMSDSFLVFLVDCVGDGQKKMVEIDTELWVLISLFYVLLDWLHYGWIYFFVFLYL